MRLNSYSIYAFIFFTTFYLAIVVTAKGQNLKEDTLTIRTEMLTVKDGLSQGLVIGIMQDKDGFLWFDSKDGLNKYDGYNFTVYRYQQDSSLAVTGNGFYNMVEDANGNMWVGTDAKGLCIFDRRNEKFYPVIVNQNNNSQPAAQSVPMQSRNGKLMVQTNRNIIYDVSKINTDNSHVIDLNKATICFDEQQMFPQNSTSNSNPYGLLNWMDDNSLWYGNTDSIIIFTPSKGIYQRIKSFSTSLFGAKEKANYSVMSLPKKTIFFLPEAMFVWFMILIRTVLLKR